MDPNELLKAAPELQKIVATIVAGVPFAEIVKRIVLPSADVLGERLKNRVERCFEKTGKMILEAGVLPQTPPDKIVIEILQGASLEENEALHTMWAALLANAASPETEDIVRPGFLASLRNLSHDEGALLNWIFDQAQLQFQETIAAGENPHDPYLATFSRLGLIAGYCSIGFGRRGGDDKTVSYLNLQTCLDGLQAAQLVQRRFDVIDMGSDGERYSLTARGWQFVKACRPPKPKS